MHFCPFSDRRPISGTDPTRILPGDDRGPFEALWFGIVRVRAEARHRRENQVVRRVERSDLVGVKDFSPKCLVM
ncbi:MAG: hypothetical protein QOJ86_1144 [Bradyrhizobium sp.]|jgi:hypothetical protein|nr:hypothetical protein [Bradyrhizobium sp.]